MEFPITEVPAVAQPTLARIAHTLRPSGRRKADVPDTDYDLLARFVRHRDESAFRSLVNRHGRTVLAACRQVLTDPADIDDAFQAAFLVLLKKAKAVDAATPLGGWLFAVAHRVAVRCRADKARRRTREAEAARTATARERVSPVTDLSWREAAAVLHAELNALPDKYRLPLLLCSVQGLTRDEAADQLGTTVGAVRGQLERGRSLLERRLTKRGIVLSAGLLAVLMGGSRSAGGPPAELIDLAVRATAGNASSTVAALAHGAFPMTTALKQVVLPLALVLGLFGIGFVGATRPPAAKAGDKPVQEMKKPKADVKAGAKSEAKERTISGKVVGENGQPVQAELSLVWQEGKEQPLGKANPDGTFKVTVPMTRDGEGGWLVAQTAGHGADFLPHGLSWMPPSMTPTAEATLKLPKERAIKGRILDQQGKPVAGASVTATGFEVFDSDASMEKHLKEWATENYNHGAPPGGDRGMWFSKKSDHPPTATTDADGRFELTGFGAGHLVTLKLTGRGVADKELVSLNRDGFDPAPTNKAAKDHEVKGFTFGGKWVLYGPDPSVVLEPEKVIRGTVTDADGKPRAGVKVTFSRTSKRDLNPDYNRATTDQDGRYEIRGARKHAGYMVEVDPDPAAGLLPCQAFADDTVGYEPVAIDVKQAKGVVAKGRVTNKATGEPVACHMHTGVMANNPFVETYPPFMNSASLSSERMSTDSDGRFRLVVIPGRVVLSASPKYSERRQYKPVAPDPKHANSFHPREGALMYDAFGGGQGFVQGNWCKVLEAKPGDTELTVDIELEPATATAVKVVDADGKPVTGAKATGVEVREFAHPTEFPDVDTLTVFNLEPEKERLLAVFHEKRNLVGTLKLTADTKDPVVTLGAAGTLTGRAVDANGKPLAGLEVHVRYDHRQVQEATGGGRNTVTADANGEFRLDTVFPDQPFQVFFHKGRKQFGADYKDAPKHTLPKHGDTLKLGDLKLEPSKDGEE